MKCGYCSCCSEAEVISKADKPICKECYVNYGKPAFGRGEKCIDPNACGWPTQP